MSLGLGLGLAAGGRKTSIFGSIFSDGTQGFWYDYSDLSTMFQDSAGTTPAALEVQVGKILDKSGRGNHATQATGAARPVLCARLNQITKSEQLDDVVWGKTACTITPNALGTLDKIVEDTAASSHRITSPGLTASAGMATVLSFRVAPAERTRLQLTFSNTTPWAGDVAPIADFSLVGAGTVNSATGGTATITALGDGTYRITFAVVNDGAGSVAARLNLHNGTSSNYTGDGVSGLYVGEAQWEVGTTFSRYQFINTATVYDDVGFKRYLRFDTASMWLGWTLPSAFTAGTIANVSMVESAPPFTVYGPNTVNAATNVGFGLADDSVTPDARGVSGNGTVLHTAVVTAVPIMPHVILATANGTTLRTRLNLGVAVSTASATNFNGTSWRLGRTLNDAGALTGRSYGTVGIAKVLSATEEDNLIKALGTYANLGL